MNYEKFYKMADATNPAESKKEATADKAGGSWYEEINGAQGWNQQLPMLALLAGTGALGGWALSAKKKKGAGAAYGAISLPALYAMYVASRRNGILPEGWDPLETGTKWINNKGNEYLPDSFTSSKKTA